MSQNQTRLEFEQEIRVRALKDPDFRQRLLDNPKGVVEEISGSLQPGDIKIKVSVYEEEPNTIYLIIPPVQTTNSELSEAELEAVAGGGFWEDFGEGFKSGAFTLGTCTPNL
ncbi:MAG: NHLP leader peptide family RiPP precursor [Waterburya sp.]